MTWQLFPAEAFAAHASSWDDLLQRHGGSPLLDRAHLAPLLEHHGSGRERIAVHRSDARVDAMCIVAPAGPGLWQTFQPPTLPLAAWLSPASSAADLAYELLGALPRLPLALRIAGLDPRVYPTQAERPFQRIEPSGCYGLVDLTQRHDQALDSGGKVGAKVRRRRERLRREGIVTRLVCVSEPADIAAATRDYDELVRHGRQAGTGPRRSPPLPGDLAEVMRAYARFGRARAYRLYFGDRLVAMDLCVDNGERIAVLATAYDETFRSASPYTLMRYEQMQLWALERRHTRLELHGRVLEWYARWRHDPVRLYDTVVYRWPLLRSVHLQWQRGLHAVAEHSRLASVSAA